MICNTNESVTLEKQHVDTLISQRVSGIFVLSGNHYEMPEDISVVYVDRRPDGYAEEWDYLVESDNDPSLTSIHQDTVSMAKRSADLLLRQIDGEAVPEKHILIPVRLVERETTR